MIDTHCHLNLPAFDADRDTVLQRAFAVGVRQLLIPGITTAGFAGVVALAGKNVHFALGLHPMFMAEHAQNGLRELEEWIADKRPVALGEVGLDFRVDKGSRTKQMELFSAQVKLAIKYGLPLLLHVIKAHGQVIALLKQLKTPFGGIVHGFNGSLQEGETYLEMGFLLGFGGMVTREKSLKIRRVAAALPDFALVLESDAPDLPPAGYGGQRNEPSYLPEVVESLARLRRVAESHIIETTSNNARTLLGIG